MPASAHQMTELNLKEVAVKDIEGNIQLFCTSHEINYTLIFAMGYIEYRLKIVF